MKAPLLSTLVVLAGITMAMPVRAQCLEKFVNNCIRDCKRNNCWPEPFVRTDRAATRIPFDMMIQRGWQGQNLLSSFHFKDDGSELNDAGKAKVRWITVEAPRQHRAIFVQMGNNAEQTAARMAAVQALAVQCVTSPEQVPQVTAVAMSPPTASADRADAVARKFHSTMPDPRLPEVKDDKK